MVPHLRCRVELGRGAELKQARSLQVIVCFDLQTKTSKLDFEFIANAVIVCLPHFQVQEAKSPVLHILNDGA